MLPGKDGQDHIATGDAGLHRLGTGGLDGGQPVIKDGTQHLDELTIRVGMWRQSGANLGQRG